VNRVVTARHQIGDDVFTLEARPYDWIGYPTFNIRPWLYSGCEGQRTIPGAAWWGNAWVDYQTCAPAVTFATNPRAVADPCCCLNCVQGALWKRWARTL
jgi:hypothetical protein